MKIVLLCGAQHNQIALAHKVAARFNLAGIVIEQPPAKKLTQFSPIQWIEKILNRTIFYTIHNTWVSLLNGYKTKYPVFPKVPQIIVPGVNTEAVAEFILQLKPDLLMVSGTSMVKKKILGLPIPKGIVNLHTGLSPYIKGGPNCTNWCIAEQKFHLIGNTIMWIDAGIDSGDIIATEITPLQGNESLLQIHQQVMDHAHELYLNALHKIENDFYNCPRIKQQSVASGTLYYSRQWNHRAKYRLLINIKKIKDYIQSAQYKIDVAEVNTVLLHQNNTITG